MSTNMTDINREITLSKFVDREFEVEHPTYDSELQFYDMVSGGEVEHLEKYGDFSDIDMKSRGVLSKDSTRNLKYHLIVTIAMITRFCIEKGMEEQTAYALSDQYILMLDEMQDIGKLKELNRTLSLDFARRMRNASKRHVLSLPCVQAMDYICNHLHGTVRVEMVAEHVGLERSYFSKLFHRETGYTVSGYVMNKKIEASKNMLLYSDFSCSEIAQYLGFASNSHFSERFKQVEGMTPGNFRKKNYRRHWNV